MSAHKDDVPDGVELLLAADALMDAASDHAEQARSCERNGDVDGASENRELSERFAQVAKWLRSIA